MYHYKGALTVGQVNRFTIELDTERLAKYDDLEGIAVRVRNTTSAIMRPAYLAGPYILYTSIREQSYTHDTPLGHGDFPPHFDANVKTNSSRWQTLPIISSKDKPQQKRTFQVDVISQSLFSPSATTYFDITLGRNRHEVRAAAKHGSPIESHTPGFSVFMQDTETIWDMPPIPRDHPGHHLPRVLPVEVTHHIRSSDDSAACDHLVVLTHGIHSNLTSDLLYLKEMIEKTASASGERIICKGFAGNACNTERGVKWLAENVGEWVLRETGWEQHHGGMQRIANPYKRISFIAHSLGGLVQIYALGYIHDKTRGRIFDSQAGGLEPINFITLATPWLGISAENPAYVKLALDFGIIGKTGQDLGLTPKPLGEYKIHNTGNEAAQNIVRSKAPLLSLLSRTTSPCHIAIRSFASRTVYANIENDGIVPLRTSSLYFLDWEVFSVEKAKVQKSLTDRKGNSNRFDEQPHGETDKASANNPSHDSNVKSDQTMEASNAGRPWQSHPSSTNPHDDYSSSDESETVNDDSISSTVETADTSGDLKTQKRISLGKASTGDEGNQDTIQSYETCTKNAETQILSMDAANAAGKIDPQQSDDVSGESRHPHISTIRSVAHALKFTGLIRRVSGLREHMSSTDVGRDNSTNVINDDHEVSPTDGQASRDKAPMHERFMASGPSDAVEDASHANAGLLGLLKPSQTHRKPSKAFTRSQTVPKKSLDQEDSVHPEEPQRTGFFKSLESVLNPPMPGSDYLTDPSTREPKEAVLVHDQYYYPDDIPPLKEIPPKPVKKQHQSHSAKRAEERERVRLEKVKLEEKIARAWHADMSWRKVLVKLPPDAHNNIIVRRTFANSHGWVVIDHLVDNHFGAGAKQNQDGHRRQEQSPNKEDKHDDQENERWDPDCLLSSPSSPESDGEEDEKPLSA